MRHGEAVPMMRQDEQRSLTTRGEAQVDATVQQLARWGIDRIIASPYVRAQQSAKIAAREFNVPLVTDASLVPEADPIHVLASIDECYSGNLLLVSHMPLVGALTSCLLGEGQAGRIHFGTADAVVIEADGCLPGMGIMVTSIYPGGPR